MNRFIRLYSGWPATTSAACLLGGLAAALVVTATAGCSHRSQAGGTTGSTSVVYVCTETKEILVAPLQKVPAVNPKTGRSTLVRGVYCADCNRWYAAPPDANRSGNPKPLRCPVHKTFMTFDGPPPTGETTAAGSP